jgi:hypothetical protein
MGCHLEDIFCTVGFYGDTLHGGEQRDYAIKKR